MGIWCAGNSLSFLEILNNLMRRFKYPLAILKLGVIMQLDKLELLSKLTNNIHRKGHIYDKSYAEELARSWVKLF